MPRLSGWIFSFALIGFVWSQKGVACSHEIPRFGLTLLDSWRKSFCETFCASGTNLQFPFSLSCTIKCPELYLPGGSTTQAFTTSTTKSGMTTSASLADADSFVTATAPNGKPSPMSSATPSATDTSPTASSDASTDSSVSPSALLNGTSGASLQASTDGQPTQPSLDLTTV